MPDKLFYGDNLDILRKFVRDETVDLCYIDPPFNSKRNYNQIYNNIGGEDRAQAQAFIDTWEWNDHANVCYAEIIENKNGVQTQQSIDLILGLEKVLKRGSLFAYLVSMTVRIAEIHRALKPTGSFYLHCDPTASHYLKLVCDALFCGNRGGEFRNEIIWCYRKWSVNQHQFVSNHDDILFYSKSKDNVFHTQFVPLSEGTLKRWKGMKQQAVFNEEGKRLADNLDEESKGSPMSDWWEVSIINPAAKERLGYPTQKPEALLERIISASSNEGDVVLDAFCGCGTTVAVANRLKRRWIGMDITYQSVALILKRLKDSEGQDAVNQVELHGVPKDMESVDALIHKKDDRVRKEFEKWAILTFSDNRAVINERKGADKGIDGVAYTRKSKDEVQPVLLSVKSGKNVGVAEVRDLFGTVKSEGAACGIYITRAEPTKPMIEFAKQQGQFKPEHFSPFDKLQIVTVQEILDGKRMNLPLMEEVTKRAQKAKTSNQVGLFSE